MVGRRHYDRKRIWVRDEYTCRYCGEAGEVIDHILPVAYREWADDCNLVVACQKCNLYAGAKWFSSFAEKRDHILERRRKDLLREYSERSELPETCDAPQWCATQRRCFQESYAGGSACDAPIRSQE